MRNIKALSYSANRTRGYFWILPIVVLVVYLPAQPILEKVLAPAPYPKDWEKYNIRLPPTVQRHYIDPPHPESMASLFVTPKEVYFNNKRYPYDEKHRYGYDAHVVFTSRPHSVQVRTLYVRFFPVIPGGF